MKKILSILTAFLCFATISFGQNNHPQGSSNTIEDFQGAIRARRGIINGRYADTASANLDWVKDQPGIQIIVVDTVFIRNITATKWIATIVGNTPLSLSDTLFAQLPAFFDSTTRSPNTILKILQGDGYTGIITWSGVGLTFNASNLSIRLNNTLTTFNDTTLTLAPADLTYSRYDIFGITTTGVFVKEGVPSPSPTIPTVGVDSFAITSGFLINPGDTVISTISAITVYDETGISPEATASTTGTITKNITNTDNPYHLTHAIFVSKYTNGSRFNFLLASPITIDDGQVITGVIYLNHAVTALNFRLFNGTTASTNSISVTNNYGLNNTLLNQYQRFAIPISAFIKSDTVFNTLRITNSGNDITGVGGYYLDYIQFQSGVNNFLSPIDYSNKQDSTTINKTTVGSDTLNVINWWMKGIPHALAPIYTHSGGEGGAVNSVTGLNTDNTDPSNPIVKISVDGTSITGSGTPGDPLVSISGGSGTVTSIGLNTPSVVYTNPVTFTTTGHTATGTLSLITQTANTVFAGSTSGGASTPTFRALVTADLPTIDTTNIANFSVKVRSLFGATSPITYVSSTGVFGCATCVVAPVNPGVGIGHFAGSTQTITSSAVNLASADVTGVLPIANGGTNNGSLSVTNQNVMISDGSKIIGLAKGNNGQHLITNGSGNLAWIDSTAAGTLLNGTGYIKMSGTTPSYISVIPIADGGTNNASLSVTNGNLFYGDGTKFVSLAVGTAGQHLVGGTTPHWVDTAAASGGATAGVINWPGTLYSTPTTASYGSNTLTFSPSLASQSAGTYLGTTTAGTPSFLFNNGTDSIRRNAGSVTVQRRRIGDGVWINQFLDSTGNNFAWQLTGNSGTDTSVDFLGTTDAKSLIFRVNNIRSGFISSDTMKANTTFGLNTAPSLSPKDSGAIYSDKFNTAIGNQALFKLHSQYVKTGLANFNVAVGHEAAYNTTTGIGNVAIGAQALYKNSTGATNMAIGHNALFNTTGGGSVAIGESAAIANTTGRVTAIGYFALASSTSSAGNTAIGYLSANNTTGADNTAIGENALYSNGSGIRNVAIGSGTIYYGTNISYNVGIGYGALQKTTSNNNTALGSFAGTYHTSGSNNVFLGNNAGSSTSLDPTESNKLFISSDSTKNLITGDFSTGQVQINSAKVPVLTPSAAFDVPSTTRGFLPPVMTTTQKNAISSPAEGLVIYDITLHKLCVYTGAGWETVTSSL